MGGGGLVSPIMCSQDIKLYPISPQKNSRLEGRKVGVRQYNVGRLIFWQNPLKLSFRGPFSIFTSCLSQFQKMSDMRQNCQTWHIFMSDKICQMWHQNVRRGIFSRLTHCQTWEKKFRLHCVFCPFYPPIPFFSTLFYSVKCRVNRKK